MDTQLAKIAKVAKERPKERFTSLMHYINQQTLARCHQELSARKARGE